MTPARRLVLSDASRATLARRAEAALPEECCGILVGRRQGDATVIDGLCATPNVSRGDRRRGFAIDPLAVLEEEKRARAAGREVVGFYHSHPEGGSRPSRRDRESAWPGASCMIVAPAGQITSWWCPASGSLIAQAIIGTAPAGERG